MQIEVILIDADGVIQYAPEDWSDAFSRCLNSDDRDLQGRFTAAIYAAETACLKRDGGFADELRLVLEEWDRVEHSTAILDAMLAICPYNEVVRVFQSARSSGIRCYLASNQQAVRARYMSKVLRYEEIFDGELYSCFLGAAKPDVEFFERALAATGAKVASTLFVDDRAENVAIAQRLGLPALLFDGREGGEALRLRLRDFDIATP